MMIKFISAAMFLITPSLMAAEANIYKCKGEGVDVRLTLSSFSGQPALKVDATNAESENAPGGRLEKIDVIETAMGYQVTGEFVEIADATLKYTLIVPHVVLNDATSMLSAQGMLVRTMVAGFIPPSAEMPQVVEGNKFTPVTCEASRVLY